jgi:glycerate 2-kinase
MLIFYCTQCRTAALAFWRLLNAEASGKFLEFQVKNLVGEIIKAEILFSNETAYIESAKVVGPQFLKTSNRTPLKYSSYGIGQLINFAAEAGAKKIVVGVGGTASLDGGEGILEAVFKEQKIDLQNLPLWLSGVEIIAATDVDVPLLGARGAVKGFGKQKGLSEDEYDAAEELIKNKVESFGRRIDGKDPSLILGAGAGGGIGYGLLALGAKRVGGLELVFEISQLEQKIATADLLITGEGSVDWQTLTGKVIMGLAQKAQNHGVPTIALAGRVLAGKRELAAAGIVGAYGCVLDNEPVPVDPFASLSALAERLGKTWRA